MHICINDGRVIFATHLIKITSPERVQDALPFSREGDTLILFSESEHAQASSMMAVLGLEYTVEDVVWDAKDIARAKGVKYQSRSEAIAHLTENKMPASLAERQKEQEILDLRREIDALKAKVKVLGNFIE